MADSRRQRRVAERIQEELGTLLQREITDPRLSMVSVTWVKVSPDLLDAQVYVSHLGDAEAGRAVLAGLEHASGFLRRELAARLSLRVVPRFHYRLDETLAHARRVDELLDHLGLDTSPQGKPPGPDEPGKRTGAP